MGLYYSHGVARTDMYIFDSPMPYVCLYMIDVILANNRIYSYQSPVSTETDLWHTVNDNSKGVEITMYDLYDRQKTMHQLIDDGILDQNLYDTVE